MKIEWGFHMFLLLVVFCGSISAQDIDVEETVPEAYAFPAIAPELSLSGGYRWTDVKGSRRVEEFEFLHDSVVLGGELRVFSFPHRLHLDLDFKNRKDYFGDLSYAYKDIVLFRGINRTLFHNLDNVMLIDLDHATASPGIAVKDGDEKYGVRFGMNSVFLRLKTPDFPFHVYLDGTLLDRDGTQQQRNMSGSGFFNEIVRASQKRDMDWRTRTVVIGANTHLGPVEVDVSHGEKRFDVKGDRVLFDSFGTAADTSVTPPVIVRPGGVFPHNLIPELRGSSDTLKIHTSYTGSLVASATFSRVDRENEVSGAKADYFIGAGDVTWMPMPKLTFFLRYRHKEADIDNPGVVTITDISNPSNTATYMVRPSLSFITDVFSGTVRYRPVAGLTLRAEYSYEDIRRKNADEWKLPGSTQRNIASLSADLRILKGLNFKARYTRREISDPAYNTEPDRSDEGRMSISWIPVPGMNATVSYSVAREKRDTLHFIDFNGNPIEGPRNRDVKRDRLLGSVTCLISKDLSLTTSYSYIHTRVEQDISFLSETFTSYPTDPSVPYRDTAHNYAVDLSYLPKNHVTLSAGVSHTVSRGTFSPAHQDLLEPVSIDAFSDLKIRETVYSASGEYRFKNGFALGLRYRYSNLKDVLENPHDDVNDGTAHMVLLTVSKRWK